MKYFFEEFFRAIKYSIKHDWDYLNKKQKEKDLTYFITLLILVVWLIITLPSFIFIGIQKSFEQEEQDKFFRRVDEKESEPVESISLNKEPLFMPVQEQEQEQLPIKAIQTLRSYFFGSNILEGVILTTKFRKLKPEELEHYRYTDELDKPYLSQRITFGENLNYLLSIFFKKKVKLGRSTKTQESYLIVKNGCIFDIELELRQMFLNDQIKIHLTDLNKNDKIKKRRPRSAVTKI